MSILYFSTYIQFRTHPFDVWSLRKIKANQLFPANQHLAGSKIYSSNKIAITSVNRGFNFNKSARKYVPFIELYWSTWGVSCNWKKRKILTSQAKSMLVLKNRKIGTKVYYEIMYFWMYFITARKWSWQRFCFYTCQSFCSQRGGVCIRGGGGLARPLPSDTSGYGQRADGTHPTEMYSCY